MSKHTKKIKVIVLALLAVLASACLGFVAYPYVVSMYRGAKIDRFFIKGPELNLTKEEALYVRDNLQLFRVDGQVSTYDWLEVLDDGSFKARGFIAISSDGFTDYICLGDDYRFLIALLVPEEVSGLLVFHAIPLIETNRTQGAVIDQFSFSFDGEPNLSDIAALGADFFQSCEEARRRNWVEVRFSLHDGWMHADAINSLHGQYFEDKLWTQGVQLNRNLFSLYLDRASKRSVSDEFWLDINAGERTTLVELYPIGDRSGMRPIEPDFLPAPWAYGVYAATFTSNLKDAALYHIVAVHYDDYNLIYCWEYIARRTVRNANVQFLTNVIFDGGRLIVVE